MSTSKVIGFIDIGTNSVRLLVIRLRDQYYEVLIKHKNPVRLGEGEFEQKRLTRTAIERTTAIIARYGEIARELGTSEIIAVATSATREAENRDEFIRYVYEQTGVRISVLSGEEEARLIWLGVSRGFRLGLEKALCIDIGGGSTEVIIGDQVECDLLISLPLGAIRLATMFPCGNDSDLMTPRAITLLRDHIGSVISVIISDMQGFPYTRIFGSSGTILALESVASEHPPLADDHKPGILTMSEIDYIVRYLSSLTLAERRRVPGLNPNRADIIIAGAVLLQALLEASGHQEIRTSDRGLIYGLVEETLAKTNDNRIPDTPLGRYHAVTGLGNKFHLDTKHARHVMNLAIMLFDSGKEIGLHNLSDTEREILIHAAYLHDIGSIISFSRHHHHSYYIISSSSMAAFSQEELRMIGLVARYHRKKPPRNRDAVLVHLHRNERRIVHILTQILRMAESLDRTHDMRVESVRFVRIPGSQEILEIFSSQDCTMETIACQETAAGFEKVFHRPLAIIQAGNHHAPASLAESGQI